MTTGGNWTVRDRREYELAPALTPLSESHLTAAGTNKDKVSLRSLEEVQNANQLKPGEKLTFGDTGITLIYGDNGSGKSGYTRISKSASASRSAEDVLPDVFDPKYKEKPAATALFKISVTDQNGQSQEKSVPWKAGEQPDAFLRQLRVFDKKGAALYVQEKTELGFIPFNLDLLDRLAGVCTKLKEKLQTELAQFDLERKGLMAGLPVGAVLTAGEAITSESETAQIADMCRWENQDSQRLSELQSLLGNAEKTQKDLQVKKTRAETLNDRINAIESALSTETITKVEEFRKQKEALRAAATAARQAAFGNDPKLLAGVGGAGWKALWDAARRYSTQTAYPKEPFPVIEKDAGGDAQCVLCQQELGAPAKLRLQSFEKYISGDIEQQATSAEQVYSSSVTNLQAIKPNQSAEDKSTIDEIEVDDAPLATMIRTYLEETGKRHASIATALDTGDFSKVSPSPASCRQNLNARMLQLDEKIKEAKAAMLAERKKELQAELSLLTGRKLFSEHKQALDSLLTNRSNKAKLEACAPSFVTTAISKAKNDLNEKYVTAQFDQTLKDELDALGCRRPVSLEVGTQKAASFLKPKFAGSTFTQLERVLSDGEHRAIALACFLTEEKFMGSKNAIVIDDPVSSLDHERRHLVARRLVEEAKDRQVVIFTHDMVFWSEIVEAAKDEVVVTMRDLSRDGAVCGIVGDGNEPWENLPVDQRLLHIEKRLPRLEQLYQAQAAEYGELSRSTAVKLRDTWERTVEETVFRKAVMRWRKGVQTGQLSEVSVEYEDWVTIENGVTRTSNWCHDRSRGAGKAVVTPREIKDEVQKFRDFTKALNARKKTVKETREKKRAAAAAPASVPVVPPAANPKAP